jgi:hypothetical protein
MANQKKSQQAKNISSMGAKAGATKAQVAQAQSRAGGKSTYNVTNKDIKKAGKAAKIIAGAAVTAVGPAKVVKGVQAATKVAKAAKAMGKLTKDEKYAVKFVKGIAKKGKPGDLRLTLDSMPSALKKDFSKALTKAAGDKSAVYKQNPRASAKAMVVQSKSTGKTKRINLN